METKTAVMGEPVHLAVQLHDQDPNRKVTCFIYSDSYERIGMVPMVHRNLGLYVSLDYLAPDLESITAQYFVDQTSDEDGYETVIEQIYIEPAPVIEERAVVGFVEAKRKKYVEGVSIVAKNKNRNG